MGHRCPLNNYRAWTAGEAVGLRGFKKITKEGPNRETEELESLYVKWKITRVYLKEGNEYQTVHLTDYRPKEKVWVWINEFRWKPAALIVFEQSSCNSLITHSKPGLHYPKTQSTVQSDMHVSPVDSVQRFRENTENWKQNLDRLQCWPTSWSMAVFLCKAAANGSTPLREKWFWLWEPLKL